MLRPHVSPEDVCSSWTQSDTKTSCCTSCCPSRTLWTPSTPSVFSVYWETPAWWVQPGCEAAYRAYPWGRSDWWNGLSFRNCWPNRSLRWISWSRRWRWAGSHASSEMFLLLNVSSSLTCVQRSAPCLYYSYYCIKLVLSFRCIFIMVSMIWYLTLWEHLKPARYELLFCKLCTHAWFCRLLMVTVNVIADGSAVDLNPNRMLPSTKPPEAFRTCSWRTWASNLNSGQSHKHSGTLQTLSGWIVVMLLSATLLWPTVPCESLRQAICVSLLYLCGSEVF